MKHYLGYNQEDYSSDFARFYNEEIQPLSSAVRESLAQSPFPSGSISAFNQVVAMQNAGYADVETGFSLEPDGAAFVAVLTPMPKVSPTMWDWWFAWHGCAADRYKLWHPKAHLDAHWEDGKNDIAYLGRTSIIAEYIGTTLEKASIQFKSPTELGFLPDPSPANPDAVYVCARIGFVTLPFDIGWLVHQIRSTPEGSEMRSRFWMGGRYVQMRKEGLVAKKISQVIANVRPVSLQQAHNIVTHCSEEMTHLAAFLPELYYHVHHQAP
ncbi:MAG: DAPG hydrolase family protein [Candidatus Kapaibacteriota bacterium]